MRAGPVEPPAALTGARGAVWMGGVDTWDPGQYQRFAAERAAPFHDLLSLVRPVPGGRVVDLGCGSGELTAQLHRRLEAAATLGLDSSPAARAVGAEEPATSRATSPTTLRWATVTAARATTNTPTSRAR